MRNSLFIKLAVVFLLILLGVVGIVGYVSQYMARQYHLEANQKLHANLAQFTVDHLPNTFTDQNEIDTTSIQELMHAMMIINPDVEVYLLSNSGEILSHVAPYKKVVRTEVSLQPIHDYIAAEGQQYIEGDDPRDLQGKKIFSAAPFVKDGETKGYYYIILASEEQATVLSSLQGTYAWRLLRQLLIFTLIGSLILGLGAFWYQTRNLSKISKVMDQFNHGNLKVRIPNAKQGDFAMVSSTFNSMADRIQTSFDKIESIDKFRKELVANISHDLRTPLSIIQGFTETMILKGTELNKEKQQEYLENIHESSKRLNGLVNQLFELSKLESNQIEVKKEPFPIDELAKDMLHRYQILASKKDITFNFEKVENLPLVFADVALVERVIQNILDNALKFTPEGGEISIQVTPEKEFVKVEITDTGSGISEEEKSAIFERYIKSEPSKSQHQGAGLGLAIAKKIIELHDSTISVNSKLNVGSTFTFQLPAHQLSA